jgi:ferredoxin
MTAGFLFNVAFNDANNIRVLPGLCKRLRIKKSNCQRCVEICPENAILLNRGPTISSSCTECGLCQNVCPTEVFRHEWYTDRYLLNQAKALLKPSRLQLSDKKKKLFFHCHRAGDQEKNSILLPCLGRITATIILGAALSGFDEIMLTGGACSECRFQKGKELLESSITASRTLLESTGFGQFAISIKEKEKQKVAMLSRREIFLNISNTFKTKAVSFLCHGERAILEKLPGNTENNDCERLSLCTELFLNLRKQTGSKSAMVVKYDPDFPWGKIKIKDKDCTACGTCVAVCPTGAISKKSDNGQKILYFKGSLCNNCCLCNETCPKHAINFEENFNLSDVFKEESDVVARIQLTSCVICGELIKAGKSKSCPTCQKRQVWPNSVNF